MLFISRHARPPCGCGWHFVETIDGIEFLGWKAAVVRLCSNRIVIHADAERANAWRIEPYYSTIKQWSLNMARSGGMLIIWAGENVTLVLPDREKELGKVRDDQIILPVKVRTARGLEPDFIVVEPDDPRVAQG